MKFIYSFFFISVFFFVSCTCDRETDSIVAQLETSPQFLFFEKTLGENTFYASFWLPDELVQNQKLDELSAVILFSGRGESAKSHKRSALGWFYDYGLPQVLQRAKAGKLEEGPWQPEFPDRAALQRYSKLLAKYPLKPLLFICPTTPANDPSAQYADFETFITQVVPDYIKEKFHVKQLHLAVDGVSFGGYWALQTLARHPELFSGAGALEAAIARPDELAAQLKNAKALPPFYLLSTKADPFLASISKFSSSANGIQSVPHFLYVFEGDHSYNFNKTLGSLHVIVWHNLTLNYRLPGDPLADPENI